MRLLLVLALVLFASSVLAQDGPDPMAPFAFMIGEWEGDAWYTQAGNQRQHIRQAENVQPMLGGSVLLIQGTGRDDAGEVVFQALGVLSYDAQASTYHLDAWNDGRHIRADVTPVDGGFDWGFEAGGRTIRYEMRLDEDGRWHETGEVMLPDGQVFPFFEMTVARTSDTP